MKNQVSSGDSKRFSLKLTINCLSLISFESSIRKKYINFHVWGGILHTSANLQGVFAKRDVD
jgi:hypothetical protein